MTDQPFTPHADSIQTAWVLMCQQSRIATQPPVEELEAEFDRFIAAEVRKAQADAWEEGYGDCWTYHQSEGMKGTEDNPYRSEED